MSSILTNNGAMVALQTMRSINKNMATTQSQISTGLKVGSAKDNAATWAISKVMESDVSGFGAIKESLALGSSTVNVARNAAETVTNLLTEIKEKVVLAQEDNVDRAKIQTDIEQLRDQIASVVGAAQFNGLNLVNGSSGDPVNILSSLDRSAGGAVAASSIAVTTANLTRAEGDPVTGFGFALGSDPTEIAAGTTDPVPTALTAALNFNGGGTTAINRTSDNASESGLLAGDVVSISFEAGGATLTAETRIEAGDDAAAIKGRLAQQLTAQSDGVTGLADVTFGVAGGVLQATNAAGAAAVPITANSYDAMAVRGQGDLFALESLTVSGTAEQRSDALRDIETMIQSAIDVSATFGSVQKRIDIQSEFVSNLMDSMRSGIGALVDADMEEASARLQALQVQQQLGIQALSIANQQPQNILALFR